MTRTTTFFALLAAMTLAACGTSFEGKDLPEISVTMGGEPGQTVFTFTNVEPGKQSRAEVSVNNIGQKDLEIYAVRPGTAQHEEGDATGSVYLLRNQVADADSVKVWVNGSSCDEGFALIANDRGLEFDAAGDCPLNPGDTVEVEKLDVEEGTDMKFEEVLLVSDGTTLTVGAPHVEGATVTAEVVEQAKAEKVIAFKFKRRKGYHRTVGHRRRITRLKIKSISA